MNDRFKFRIAVYERQQNNMPWAFVEYIDPDNQHWGLNQCGDIISDSSYSAHYTRKNAPDSVHRVYEPEQCTGLSDKNGKLIYEGDVVYDSVYENNFVVSWDNDRTGYTLSADNTNHIDYLSKILIERHNLKIIGNIHEQAEQKDK